MNDAFWIALPAIIAAAFAGINTVIAAICNSKIEASKQEVVAKVDSVTKDQTQTLSDKSDRIEDQINGRMTNKITLASKEGYERGVLDGSEILSRVDANSKRIDILDKRFDQVETTMNRILVVVSRIKGAATDDNIEKKPA